MAASSEGGLSRKALVSLWLTVCLDMVAFGIILPILPFQAEALGARPAEVAALAGAFSLTQMFAGPLLGRLGDRVGRRPVLLISVAGSCVAMVILGLATSLLGLFVARLLSGACSANLATAQATVADHVAPDRRAAVMGKVGSAIGVGLVLGPVFGGLLASAEVPSLPFWVAAALIALDFALASAWLPRSAPAAIESSLQPEVSSGREVPAPSTPVRRFAPAVLGLMAIKLGTMAAFAGMESTFALLVEDHFGWGSWETGLVFALVGVVSVVTHLGLIGPVVARFGERTTLTLGLAVLSVGLAAIGGSGGPLGVSLGACMVAVGNGWAGPTFHALASQRAAAGRSGALLGAMSSAASLGRVLGPLTAGLMFEALGPGAPSLLGAACVLALAGLWATLGDGAARGSS